jgi:hypothetical protein
VAILVLMLAAKHVIAARETGANPLAALPGGAQVAAGLDIGGVPTDEDLTGLAGSYRVDGVVNLTDPSVGEAATAAFLHLSYLHVPLAADAAPSLPQLRSLAAFIHGNTANGDYVYLHDQGGGGPAVVTASMLLELKGQSWSSIERALTPGEIAALSHEQTQAIADLSAALAAPGKPLPGNQYAGARLDSW